MNAKALCGAIVVAAVAAVVYSNTLANGFVSDDNALIFQHPFVPHVRDWPRIFTAGHYEGTGGYRPLVTLSFAFNYCFGGRNPVGYHLINILLHAANSVLVLLLLSRLLLGRAAAFVGALIFAVHPIHTEAVAWISGRAEVLAAFFFFIAWLLHLRSRQVTSLWSPPRVLSAVALFAALLSKENALIFPGVIVAGDVLISRWQSHCDALTNLSRAQRWARLYLPSLAAIALYFIVRGLLYHQPIWRLVRDVQFVDNPLAHVPLIERLLTAGKIQLEYLRLLVWPRHLCADYSYNSVPIVTNIGDPIVLSAFAVCALLFVIAVWSFSHRGRLWFGIVFYAFAVAPVANVLTVIGTIKAERLLYLPSFGLCFIVGVGIVWLSQTRLRLIRFSFAVSTALFAAVIASAGFATWKRNSVWRDERSLWQSVADTVPNNIKAQLHVGSDALASGDDAKAIGAFRAAMQIDSQSEDAVINLSAALMQDQQYGEATRILENAVSQHPSRAVVHLNLGLAYLGVGRPASAIAELRHACDLDPSNAVTRFNLALALSKTGDPESAVGEYRRALDIDPNYAEAWNGLGAAFLKLRRNDQARDALRHALALRPQYRDAIYNMTLLDAPR